MPFASWCVQILPYLERAPLWRQAVWAFGQDRNFLNDPPHSGLSTPVRDFACPSDSRVRQAQVVGGHSKRAFTSYLGVEGSDAFRIDGVFFLDSRIRVADITDGTSNTLMVGQHRRAKT